MAMDPSLERRLTEEVLHLHSLWRRGPPRNREPIHSHSATADVANRNPSNNARKRPRDQKLRKGKNKNPRPAPKPPEDSGPEWPCPEPVENQASTSSGWPPIEPSTTPAVQPVSSEDRAKLSAMKLQYKESRACRGFFARNGDSGSDEEEEGNDGEVTENEEYKFFLKLFGENNDLRSYYETNSEGGSFCCLVCGGMGKKNSGKKFKSCIGLVQHSISISRTKKRRAHRAFGRVICRVFGWDIDRLPTIVLKGEPLGRSLADSGDLKVQSEENHVAKEHDSGVQSENEAILDDNNDQKNEEISVDGNEHKLEKEKAAENPDFNDKDLISGENENACKENDDKAKNVDNSISDMGAGKAEMENLPVPQLILTACKEFFADFSLSTSDDDVSETNVKDGDGLEERKEFKFFLKLFMENEGLRRYYENNYENGEFFCLACKGTGKKTSKRFKTCGSLLQHSTSLAHKTHSSRMVKMKALAHRAYSLVVCKVLGWDIKNIPAIVLKGEPLGRSLSKPGMPKDETIGNAVGNTNDSNDLVENG